MGCYNSIVINAPADDVFNTLKDFNDLSWSKNVISKVELVGGKSGHEIGARRVLNDAFHETLLSVDNDKRNFSYSIDAGPGPLAPEMVKGYIGRVSVRPITENNTAFVQWSSSWDSEEGGVAEFCNPIYHALLQDLKAHYSQ